MEPLDASGEVSNLIVKKDAIIETVAQEVLNEHRPIPVVDENDNVVGTLQASHVINVLFGGQSEK